MNARHNQRVFEPCVAITGGPLSEGEFQAIELETDVSDQSRRSKIEHTQPGVLSDESLNEQTCLDGLTQADFIGNQHPLERWRLLNVLDQAHLMGERVHLSRIEATLWVFADQKEGTETRQTPTG